MAEQKFHNGDLVRVAKDLGSSMFYSKSDCDAIVTHSYREKYGGNGDGEPHYSIHLKGRGEVSWYYESQLILIEAGRVDLLETWKAEEKAEANTKRDLDWIFSHGEEVLKTPHGASVAALAACFGLMDLWGKNGEGFTYVANFRSTMGLAKRFLQSGDKAGWLLYCVEITSGRSWR